jgi:hypothetical protein
MTSNPLHIVNFLQFHLITPDNEDIIIKLSIAKGVISILQWIHFHSNPKLFTIENLSLSITNNQSEIFFWFIDEMPLTHYDVVVLLDLSSNNNCHDITIYLEQLFLKYQTPLYKSRTPIFSLQDKCIESILLNNLDIENLPHRLKLHVSFRRFDHYFRICPNYSNKCESSITNDIKTLMDKFEFTTGNNNRIIAAKNVFEYLITVPNFLLYNPNFLQSCIDKLDEFVADGFPLEDAERYKQCFKQLSP